MENKTNETESSKRLLRPKLNNRDLTHISENVVQLKKFKAKESSAAILKIPISLIKMN
jgi:hypothetical protein